MSKRAGNPQPKMQAAKPYVSNQNHNFKVAFKQWLLKQKFQDKPDGTRTYHLVYRKHELQVDAKDENQCLLKAYLQLSGKAVTHDTLFNKMTTVASGVKCGTAEKAKTELADTNAHLMTMAQEVVSGINLSYENELQGLVAPLLTEPVNVLGGQESSDRALWHIDMICNNFSIRPDVVSKLFCFPKSLTTRTLCGIVGEIPDPQTVLVLSKGLQTEGAVAVLRELMQWSEGNHHKIEFPTLIEIGPSILFPLFAYNADEGKLEVTNRPFEDKNGDIIGKICIQVTNYEEIAVLLWVREALWYRGCNHLKRHVVQGQLMDEENLVLGAPTTG